MTKALAIVIGISWAVLLVPLTASADVDTSVSLRYPPQDAVGDEAMQWTPVPDSVVQGKRKVVADASASSSLKRFSISIEPEDDAIGTLAPEAREEVVYQPGQESSDTLTYEWESEVVTPRNGVYRVVAFSESHVGGKAFATSSGLKVNNPPAQVMRATATIEQTTARIEWESGSEPDILHYVIQRSSGGTYSKIGESTTNRFVDQRPPKDVRIQYRIVAVRYSPVDSSGISGPPSRPTASIAILTAASTAGAPPPPPPPPLEVVLPARDPGFAPALPYSLPGQAPSSNDEGLVESIGALPKRVASQTVGKVPFIAAALFLFTTGMALMKTARRLLTA